MFEVPRELTPQIFIMLMETAQANRKRPMRKETTVLKMRTAIPEPSFTLYGRIFEEPCTPSRVVRDAETLNRQSPRKSVAAYDDAVDVSRRACFGLLT